MPNFDKLASDNATLQNQDPQFKCGEIVYLFDWRDDGRSNHEWPTVGSRYEIDLKIIDFFSEKTGVISPSGLEGSKWFYNVISGRGYHINSIPEANLIRPNEKSIVCGNATIVLAMDTEYAKAGVSFNRQGDYWINEDFGIYLSSSVVNELKKSNLFEEKNKQL